jgi:hypothetical protein
MSEPKTSLPLHYVVLAISTLAHHRVLGMSHLVMNSKRKFLARIGHVGGIAEAVNSQAACKLLDPRDATPQLHRHRGIHANWGQEHFDVATSDQLVLSEQLKVRCPLSACELYYLRVAATGVLEERSSECALIYIRRVSINTARRGAVLARKPTNAKSLGDPRQIPDWFNCELRHSELACIILADLAIRHTIEADVSEFSVCVIGHAREFVLVAPAAIRHGQLTVFPCARCLPAREADT